MEQQELQKRLLLALVLSFFVFAGYSYLFPPVKPQNTAKQETNKTTTASATPKVVNTNIETPTPITTTTQNKEQKVPTVQTTSKERLVTIKSKKYILNIDKFGRFSQITLLEHKYHNDAGGDLELLDPTQVRPLEIRFADSSLNEEAFKTPYTSNITGVVDVESAKSIILTQKLSSLTVTKTITFKPNGAYDLKVETSNKSIFFLTTGHRPVADDSIYMLVRGALIKEADKTVTTIDDGDAKGTERFVGATIASSFDRYVTSLFYNFDKGMNVSILKEANGDPLIFIQGDKELNLGGYFGAKDQKKLFAIHPELTDAIYFGFFSFLSKPFFAILLWIYDIVGNWGWAIILFTILVKLVLFPLSYKGMMSMQKLKDLAPKMKEIKEKYKGDSAKMNAQMMQLYKKHGANPMGGCLPLLMQIPIFFALYRVLLNAVELQGAPWILWIDDLSRMDIYFVLPILMGASMWFQQRITPSNFTDPLQEKIFKWFPVVMTIFFVYFPSGLVLYWLINNIFTIGQQKFINIMYEKHKALEVASHKKKTNSEKD